MAEIIRKNSKKKSQGAFLKDSIMTGISYMIPVIVGGGVLQAIAKMMGGYDIGSNMQEIDTLAKAIMLIGQSLWNFTVPVVAAFTAYAMADKPGIAPGLALGVLANSIGTGFVGGLIGGVMVGYCVLMMKKIKIPKGLQGVMPILIIPTVATLVCGLVMYYIIGHPIAWLSITMQTWLIGLGTGSKFVFGAVVGAMMCFDMGGPVGKAAAMVTNGLNADGFFIPTSAKMCAGMTAPLGIAIATFIGGRKKFDDVDRENAKSAMMLSCVYIEEAVIPFLVNDPIRVIVSCMIGGSITGGLCMVSALSSPAVHGGVFVIPMTSKPLLFVGLWLLGSCITGVTYALWKKPLADSENATQGKMLSKTA